ncbi:glycosyltransferase family 4 protein [Henriciella aquimarina]|uniref:glycosyltransferase family 4 protein n=1 Tax=Henriciella aquimarina TaxID=545261 RepID=UPI000A06C1B1|nr:glycosyltransferase family 1 protein [Henriciella aquimarina]
MNPAETFYINGRFLNAPPRGVQRVAREVLRALDDLLGDRPGDHSYVLLAPGDADVDIPLSHIKVRHVPGPKGQLWEQWSLANAARTGFLINLANTAPLKHPRNIVMIHDAQTHDTPTSYPLAFRAWYGWLQPKISRRASAVATVSAASADALDFHGVTPKGNKAQVIHNGVDHVHHVEADPTVLARKGLEGRNFALAFASQQEHKNFALLDALSRRPELEALTFAFIGQPPAESPPPSDTTVFLGGVNDAELRALYEQAFVFLMPSLTEGFGLPVGEAMLCGCPAIAAEAGALPEIWAGGARFAPAHDTDVWTDHLVSLLNNETERAALVEAGEAVARQYSWHKTAEALRHLCESASVPLRQSA